MKVTLTRIEAEKYIREILNLNDEDVLEIENLVVGNLSTKARQVLDSVSPFTDGMGGVPGGNKIAAIRALRNNFIVSVNSFYENEYSLSLVSSKEIIENWGRFVNKIQTNGDIPPIISGRIEF